jgi:exonuclease III
MIILSWNCRGLGNPWTVRDLRQMAKEKKLDIVFLIETKCKKGSMEKLRVQLGFNGLFVVDPVGLSGGLALLWKGDQVVEIQNYTARHINATIKHSDREGFWKLTCFYRHPICEKRKECGSCLSILSLIPQVLGYA